jgi:hypothetical protein
MRVLSQDSSMDREAWPPIRFGGSLLARHV